MTLTDRLDELMAAYHIKSKAELARLSEIPYTTIDGIYKKGSDNITLKTLRRLCDFFGCTLDYLANGDEDRPENNPTIAVLLKTAVGSDDEEIKMATEQLQRLKMYREKITEAQNVHPDTEKR